MAFTLGIIYKCQRKSKGAEQKRGKKHRTKHKVSLSAINNFIPGSYDISPSIIFLLPKSEHVGIFICDTLAYKGKYSLRICRGDVMRKLFSRFH